MLDRNNVGVSVSPATETTICEWDADGIQYLVGFSGTGSYSALFRLYVFDPVSTTPDMEPWYVGEISQSNRNAYVADRGKKLAVGLKVRLTVEQDGPGTETFYGTILGS